MNNPVSSPSFAYVAQNAAGEPISGTIDSPDIDSAAKQLNSLSLRVTRLAPSAPPQRARLSGSDLTTLNHQLAYLTQSNLPMEKGLRLLADEMSSASLAPTMRFLAADLEAGMSLDEAIDRRREQFPPIYSAIVHAGLASGSLGGALLNFNRHLELVARLRSALWRAMAYPLLLIAMLLVVLTFIGRYIAPQYNRMLSWSWSRPPSAISQMVFAIAENMPVILIVMATLAILGILVGLLLRAMRPRGTASDALLSIPVVGSVLRKNLLARWCDALELTVAARMPLPQAVVLAGQMVGSPRLERDSQQLAAQLSAGQPLDAPTRLRLLPPTVLHTAQLAAEHGELPRALDVLTTMYQQAAELRLNALQTTLTPAMIVVVAVVMFVVIAGLLGPMIAIF